MVSSGQPLGLVTSYLPCEPPLLQAQVARYVRSIIPPLAWRHENDCCMNVSRPSIGLVTTQPPCGFSMLQAQAAFYERRSPPLGFLASQPHACLCCRPYFGKLCLHYLARALHTCLAGERCCANELQCLASVLYMPVTRDALLPLLYLDLVGLGC